MEKQSTQVAPKIRELLEGNKERKAITKEEMATASIKEIPLEPVSINYPKSNLYPTPFTVVM